MSKDTIKQAARDLFASTAHDVLWANPKGEFFTSENIGSLSLKQGQKLTKFERQEESETSTSDKKDLSANDAIAKIKAVTSLEDLKNFEGDERKSVKSVYAWMEKKLTDQITVVGATDAGNKDNAGQK
jgi:hypothetical protein